MFLFWELGAVASNNSLCSPSKTEEDQGTLQDPANEGAHGNSGKEPLGQTRGPWASQRHNGSILSHREMMPHQHDRIVSSMVIHSDEQLPITSPPSCHVHHLLRLKVWVPPHLHSFCHLHFCGRICFACKKCATFSAWSSTFFSFLFEDMLKC